MNLDIILGREIFEKPLDFYINTCSYENYDEILTHQHSFIELNYVSNGTGIHHLNGMHYDVSKGDFYLIPPGVPHVYLPYDICNTNKLTTINCIFYPEFIFPSAYNFISKTLSEDLATFCEMHLSLETFAPDSLRFQDDTPKTICYLLERMLKEYQQSSLGYLDILRSNLLELVIHMKRYSSIQNTPKDYTSYSTNQLIHTAIAYLEENYLNPISLDDICNYVMLSKCYFCTQFKSATGMSVIHYLQKIRMKKASELLLKSNYNITTISQMVGYCDYNFFTKTFKKIIGVTPREYRKKYHL